MFHFSRLAYSLRRNPLALYQNEIVQCLEMKNGHVLQFIEARDPRNRKIPELRIRNGKFYGYLWKETEAGKRTPRPLHLNNDGDGMPCSNLASAKTALDILQADRPRA